MPHRLWYCNDNMKKRSLHWLVTVLLVINLAISGSIIVYLANEHDKTPFASALPFETTEQGKYVLYIGTNDKDTYTQQIPLDEAEQIVNEICSKYVKGYTVQQAEGGWVDESGILTEEQTLVYSFDAVREEDLVSIMDEVLVQLNQASILVERQDLTYCYYSGGE